MKLKICIIQLKRKKGFHATVELIQYAGKHVMTQTCVHFLLAGDAVEWETKGRPNEKARGPRESARGY